MSVLESPQLDIELSFKKNNVDELFYNLSENPEGFKKVFFDPRNILDELISGDRFILYGRKGDGKTAYSAQIKLTAPDKGFFAFQRSLSNFNNATFTRIKTNEIIG